MQLLPTSALGNVAIDCLERRRETGDLLDGGPFALQVEGFGELIFDLGGSCIDQARRVDPVLHGVRVVR